MIRKIIAYKDPFIKFYKSQDSKTQDKIEYVLDLVRFEKQVPIKFFKYPDDTDGIYEVRVITAFKSVRILCFFDKGEFDSIDKLFHQKDSKNTKAIN
jgi:hypothetical protein